jgi:mRNA interferase MazF
VLSPALYNARASLMLACPITSQPKRYPFEVHLPGGLPIAGCVLADHVKSVDWRARDARRIGATTPDFVVEAVNRIAPLLGV